MFFIIILLAVFILGLLLKNRRWALVVFAFVVLFPMRTLVSQEHSIFGIVGPDSLMPILVIFFYYFDKNYFTRRIWSNNKLRWNSFLLMIIFILILNYIAEIQKHFISNTDISFLPKRIIRDTINVYCFHLILRRVEDIKVYKSINKGIIVGSILIASSIFFSSFFSNLGLMPGMEMQDQFEGDMIGQRNSGFLGLNPNGSGAYCAFMIGYCLAQIEKSLNNPKRLYPYIICIGFLFLGIMGTGSRTSLLASSIVFIIFALKMNFTFIKKSMVIFVIFMIGYYIYEVSGSYMEYRINDALENQGGTLVSRIEHWKEYGADLLRHPHYFLIGHTNISPTRYGHHNYYLYLVWTFGLPTLLIFLFLIRAIMNDSKKYKSRIYSFTTFYSSLTFLITSIAGSDPPNYMYIIVFIISPGIFTKINLKYKKSEFTKLSNPKGNEIS